MRNSQVGFSLLESLISIVIVSFGILGMLKFQSNMIDVTTTNGVKLESNILLVSLNGYIDADSKNYKCYTYPVVDTSTNCVNATKYINSWVKNVTNIKGAVPLIELDTSDNLIVSITWKSPRLVSHKSTTIIHPITGV